MEQEIRAQAETAKAASYRLAALRTDARNKALCAMADALMAHIDKILHENAADVEDAKTSGMRASYLDRLRLDEARIASMAEGLRLTAALPDPLGREDYSVRRPNGLEIRRMRVPLGVVGMIYEARPNVTADAMYDDLFHDKKTVGGRIHWVLAEEIGRVCVHSDVPEEIVRKILSGLSS